MGQFGELGGRGVSNNTNLVHSLPVLMGQSSVLTQFKRLTGEKGKTLSRKRKTSLVSPRLIDMLLDRSARPWGTDAAVTVAMETTPAPGPRARNKSSTAAGRGRAYIYIYPPWCRFTKLEDILNDLHRAYAHC